MNEDLHYYGMAVTARAAGFDEADALTIAYASQYVDDATEGEPIRVGEVIFEPVRTAHYGLQAYNWSAQKRIFIPFHFIPPKPIRRSDDTFITAPASSFANMVWKQACAEKNQHYRLIRMGIALHAYADSWSHKWFSGRLNSENDVEAIHIYQEDKGRWKHLKWDNILLDILPQVGHAEAGGYPDRAQTRWKYRRRGKKRLSERNNSKDFLKAFKKMHAMLAAASMKDGPPIIPWEKLQDRFAALFTHPAEDLGKRCRLWQQRFAGHFKTHRFEYNKYQWRKQALNPVREDEVRWDEYSRRDFGRLQFGYNPDFYESDWVLFHRGALKQRHFVLEHLV